MGRIAELIEKKALGQASAEELKELEEALAVDQNVDNPSDGWMGVTVGQKRQQRDEELAAARDEEEEQKREEEEKAMSDLKAQLAESKKENSSLITKIAKIEKDFVYLRESIENLSLSNSKLLYTNKVLRNTSLNERQKTQIVEAISKAKSTTEAKTLFETLQSAVETVPVEKAEKQSLSEAMQGRNPFLVRKQTVQMSELERLQKLAGIK